MSKLHVKKGDKVLVIAGKDKGKTGEILATNSAKSFVIVSGVNIQTHHNKPKSREDKGGIVKSEAAIDVSNVMLVCPMCGKATRVHHNIVDGKSVRVCKCGAVLDKKYEKTKKVEKKVEKTEKKAEKATKAEKAPVKTTEKPTKIKATASKTKTEKVVAKVKRGDA